MKIKPKKMWAIADNCGLRLVLRTKAMADLYIGGPPIRVLVTPIVARRRPSKKGKKRAK